MIANQWWASAFLIFAAQSAANIDAIQAAVKYANESGGGREAFTGLLVIDAGAASVLVMSRRHGQGGRGYRWVAGVLRGIRAPFILTEPLAIPRGPEPSLN